MKYIKIQVAGLRQGSDINSDFPFFNVFVIGYYSHPGEAEFRFKEVALWKKEKTERKSSSSTVGWMSWARLLAVRELWDLSKAKTIKESGEA